MNVHRTTNAAAAGREAAAAGAAYLREVISLQGGARIILATGASQFAMLAALVMEPSVDWSRVTMFHLDEYIGLPVDHPASFRRYLQERFIAHVPLGECVLIDGEGNPEDECRRLAALMRTAPIDLAFVGIGENCHLAFNDPPADFVTEEPYLIVDLDRECRAQQVAEGWFPTLEDVPQQAISMSVRQILAARKIICVVPGPRKARAVQAALEEGISPDRPASILREHPNTELYIDPESAGMLAHR